MFSKDFEFTNEQVMENMGKEISELRHLLKETRDENSRLLGQVFRLADALKFYAYSLSYPDDGELARRTLDD